MNSWMNNTARAERRSKPTLLMHPDDADRRSFVEGQRIVNNLASTDAADWEPTTGNLHLDGIAVSINELG